VVRILVPSAAYVLTDYLLSSEGISCYNLFKSMERFGYFFEAVSAYVRIKKLLKNVNFHQVGTFKASPTSNLIKKYVGHVEFITRSYLKSTKILKEKEISIVHHMFPAVYNQSFNPLALLEKTRGRPFVFGPISAHFYPRPLDEKVFMGLTSKLHMETIRKCDRVITITQQVKNLYSRAVEDEKIGVIPIGVDTSFFKPQEKCDQRDFYEILCVGYLYKLKGVEFLIRSMEVIAKEQRDVKLRIVGEGPEKSRLRDLTKVLDLEEKVIFEGLVPHTKIANYYQQCDIFCFPTLGEPFGKVVLEAMACGKPVVASKIGGPVEIIQDGETGFLVPPAQPKILADTILKLLSEESTMRKIGASARKAVVQKYSWEKIAELYHKLYKTLK